MIVACKKPAETVLSTPDLGEFAKHRNFLSKADKVILYSTESSRSQGGADPKTIFHGYNIFGSVEISDSKRIEQIAEDMEKNIYTGSGSSDTMCFDPRHGLRIFSEGGTRDFQICFECRHLYVYEDITTDDHTRIGLAQGASSELLNHILDENGIPKETTTK